MTEPDDTGPDRPRRHGRDESNDENAAPDESGTGADTGAPTGLSRRTLLRGVATSGGIGTAGCLFLGRSDEPATGTEAPVRADGENVVEAASDPAFAVKEPQLATSWTAEVAPDEPRPEYPRPQMVRDEWENLNGVWQFAAAAEGESPPFDTDLDEGVLVPFPIESGLSGVKRYEPRMWYRRTFSVPDSWDVGTRRLLLHLERVDWEATVYVNGEAVTTHRGGYDHFAADVTDALVDDGPQELVVGVYDPTGLNTEPRGTQPKGRQGVDGGVNQLWKQSVSGIWDTVWMESVPETYVDGLDMTPDLETETLRLTVETSGAGTPMVEATAFEDGTEVGTVSGLADRELDLPVPDSRHWSPENPFLYDLEIRLLDGDGTVVDAVESYFGMRSLGTRNVGAVSRPTLNGELYYFLGTLDSGYWPDGLYTAPTDEAIRFHLQAQKDLGFNTVRMHSKLETRRWFYHADRVGLLVWQDVPNMDENLPDSSIFPPMHHGDALGQFRSEVRAMVAEHDTHPSLAIWTPFNEGWGIDNDNLAFVREVADLVAKADPERLVDAISGHNVGSNGDPGVGDFNDVHNYPGLIAPDPDPGRISALGEYTSGSMHLAAHTYGGCGGTSNGDAYVSRYVDTVEQLREFVVDDGLGASVYTATTDLAGVCNGMLTYDRRVVKPDEAEDGVEKIRRAHEDLLETVETLEYADLAVETPGGYDPGSLSPSPEPFELAVTFTNPESVETVAGPTEDVELALRGVPDDWTVSAEPETRLGAVADGESVTAAWEIVPETAEGAVELAAEAKFRVDDGSHELRVSREVAEVRIASWEFDGNTADSVAGYGCSLEDGVEYDEDAVEGSHSLRFDGDGGYALLSDFEGAPSFLHESFSERTVATWIRPDSTTGRQCIFNEGGTVNGFGVRIQDGTLEASVASGETVVSATTPFDRTDWTHVAAVFDEGALRLYVDGTEVDAESDVGYDVVPDHVAGAELGGATTTTVWGDGDAFFAGNVDATGFYRRALDSRTISSLADAF